MTILSGYTPEHTPLHLTSISRLVNKIPMSYIGSIQKNLSFCLCKARFFLFFFTVISGVLAILPAKVAAQGDLLITPKRVVFEGSRRSMDLNLANIGQDTATYSISILQIRMKENGGFETITEPDPGQRFADRHIRYFPRTVTLGPKESQVVKLQVIRQGELTEGEYRSHIYFRAVPREKPLGKEETLIDSTSISVRLTPIFGITIPVIIRVGGSTARVSISDASLSFVENETPLLSLVFNRSGNMSVYGDLTVDHISSQGTITRVGIANGIAVYTPNTVRRFQFSLNKAPGVDYRSGKLSITYSSPSDVKPERFAGAEIQLNR